MIAARRDIMVRPYRPGDEAEILTSFNTVFRRVCGDGYVNRDAAHWRWQFHDNPAGRRIWLAATPDGEIAAHYGGISMHVVTEFGDRVFSQAVDCFAHPDYRHGLQKTGIFVSTGRKWFDECQDRGDAVTFGFPVPSAERIGTRMMDYAHLCTVDYLCRDVDPTAATRGPEATPVRRITGPSTELDSLWRRQAETKKCLTRRDAVYLGWRYLDTPRPTYELWGAHRDGELVGAMALRPVHELVPGACSLADWIVPEADVDATDALLACAHRRAAAHRRRVVLAVFPDWSPEQVLLRRRGFAWTPSSRWLERRLAHRTFDPDMPSEWLRENWWFTLGDSDLV